MFSLLDDLRKYKEGVFCNDLCICCQYWNYWKIKKRWKEDLIKCTYDLLYDCIYEIDDDLDDLLLYKITKIKQCDEYIWRYVKQ